MPIISLAVATAAAKKYPGELKAEPTQAAICNCKMNGDS
jgi:hypothetical protein